MWNVKNMGWCALGAQFLVRKVILWCVTPTAPREDQNKGVGIATWTDHSPISKPLFVIRKSVVSVWIFNETKEIDWAWLRYRFTKKNWRLSWDWLFGTDWTCLRDWLFEKVRDWKMRLAFWDRLNLIYCRDWLSKMVKIEMKWTFWKQIQITLSKKIYFVWK